MKPGCVVCVSVVEIATSRSGSDTETARSPIALSTLKIAIHCEVFAGRQDFHWS